MMDLDMEDEYEDDYEDDDDDDGDDYEDYEQDGFLSDGLDPWPGRTHADPEEAYDSDEFYDSEFDRGAKKSKAKADFTVPSSSEPFRDEEVPLPASAPDWSTLPQEIQDAIVDAAWELSCDSWAWKDSIRRTLHCVSRSWALRARRFSLERISVLDWFEAEHWMNMIRDDIAGRSPLPFCVLIRELRVAWDWGEGGEQGDADASDAEGSVGAAATGSDGGDGGEDEVIEDFETSFAEMIEAFPNLSSVDIGNYNPEQTWSDRLRNSLRNCTNLSQMTFDCPPYNPALDSSTTRDLTHTVQLLSALPQLRTVCFPLWDSGSPTYIVRGPFPIPAVTDVEISMALDSASFTHMLDSFPALTSLKLESRQVPNAAALAALARLAPQLQFLSVALDVDGDSDGKDADAPQESVVSRQLIAPALELPFPVLEKLHIETAAMPRNVMALLTKAHMPKLGELILESASTQIGTRSVRTLVRDGALKKLAKIDVKSVWAWDDSDARAQQASTVAWCKRRGIELLFEAYEY